MVKYVYDAWGNHAVLDGAGNDITDDDLHIGNLNPFRYRGYFYDPETELYYLQTRYYDPEVGRFITIDAIEYLDPESINGLNLYAYCGNNPVMGYDPDGTWDWGKFWKNAFGFMIGLALAAVAVLGVVLSQGTLLIPVLAGLAVGAGANFIGQGIGNVASGKGFFEDINYFSVGLSGVAGAAFATGLGGAAGAILIGAAANAGNSAFEQKSWANIGLSALAGGIAAGIGFGAGKYLNQQVFKNSDFVFTDFYKQAQIDTNKFQSLKVALRSTWLTFIPAITPGILRGLSKFFWNMGISKI